MVGDPKNELTRLLRVNRLTEASQLETQSSFDRSNSLIRDISIRSQWHAVSPRRYLYGLERDTSPKKKKWESRFGLRWNSSNAVEVRLRFGLCADTARQATSEAILAIPASGYGIQ